MKTKLLLFSFLMVSSLMIAQVTPNHVDDFEDGTPQDWIINANNVAVDPPLPFNVAGGPTGNFLRYETTGNPGGAGSKMVIINQGSNWTGDFTAAGIVAVRMDVNITESDVDLRVAFEASDFSAICTTNAVSVAAGSGWQTIIIPIQASDFTALGPADINAVLTDVASMRILSRGPNPGLIGDTIDVTFDADNITASTTLSTAEVGDTTEFSISPNPATSRLNVTLSTNTDYAEISVFDVLGKRVYVSSRESFSTTSIDISNWNSGVYLVRIATDMVLKPNVL